MAGGVIAWGGLNDMASNKFGVKITSVVVLNFQVRNNPVGWIAFNTFLIILSRLLIV